MEYTDRAQDALQLEALLVSRAYLYELFHKLLGGAPDEATLAALLGSTTADVVDEFGAADEALKAFGGFLAAIAADDQAALLDRAHDEYTRVFVGPAALPASPYESPYTGAHDMGLFQENTLAVRAAYHAYGLRVRREQAVPDDHVALLCAFQAQLAKRAIAAFREGEAAELAKLLRESGAFAEAHLAGWVGTYAESVRNSKAGAAAVLYPQLLEALAAFVRSDVQFTVEAAYWAEGAEFVPAAAAVAPELAGAYDALVRLGALHPFGIQDNELIPVE